MSAKTAIAIAAHPDDIEFYMAGTLLLLKKAGYRTHYFCLTSGNCGTQEYSTAKIKAIRASEARKASAVLGAQHHPSITDDLEIIYSVELLRRVAAVIREVRPAIVLTHSPQDYMEDHMNASRLAVTAAFARGLRNFRTSPRRDPADEEVTVYHAMPHGLCDGLRRRIIPGAFVDTTSVQETKRQALAAHRSQQGWLAASQGMSSYLRTMEEMSLEVGRMSKKFAHAEGWRRRLHFGFGAPEADPLRDALGKRCRINKSYELHLDRGA